MRKLFVLLLIIGILVVPQPIGAQNSQSFDDLNAQIKDLEAKITDAQSKEKSLSSQISYMDSQIKLTTLRIEESSAKIEQLVADIEELGTKIATLEQSLDSLSTILIDRVVSTYKVGKIGYFTYFFSSSSIGDFLRRNKYLETAQEHDKKVMFEIQQTKATYGEQKNLREEKKQQQEALKIDLELQKKNLDSQKREKQSLLEQTRSSETEYQRLLQNALAEKNALEAALVSGVKVGEVNKGDPIALVGNTGYPSCSTGAHLHFEVRKNNSWVNAGDYLKSQEVQDDQDGGTTTVGSGNWDWPLKGTIRMTQHYGKTPYSWRYAYSGGIHTGIDMVPGSGESNVIYAPEKGTLYSSSQSCGSSTIKIKYIEHGDGVISFYLHVQ